MRYVLFAVALAAGLLLAPLRANAQSASSPVLAGPIALTSTNSAVTLTGLGNQSSFGISVSSAAGFSATFVFECTTNGPLDAVQNWQPLTLVDRAGATHTSATSAIDGTVTCPSGQQLRVRESVYASGTPLVTIYATAANPAGASGIPTTVTVTNTAPTAPSTAVLTTECDYTTNPPTSTSCTNVKNGAMKVFLGAVTGAGASSSTTYGLAGTVICVATSAVTVLGVTVENNQGATTYVQSFNAASAGSVTLGTTTPAFETMVAANLMGFEPIPAAIGSAFSTGYCYAATTASKGASGSAAGVNVTVWYI